MTPSPSSGVRTREGDLVTFLLLVPLAASLGLTAWDWGRESMDQMNRAHLSLAAQDAQSARIIGPMHPLFWVIFGYIVWALPAGAAGAWFALLSEDLKNAQNGAWCALATGMLAWSTYVLANSWTVASWVEIGTWTVILLAPTTAAGALCGWFRRRPISD